MTNTLFFYRLYKISPNNSPKFCGTAFPITPTGDFLTCFHVLDQMLETNEYIAILDFETSKFIRVENFKYDKKLDIALLINPLKKNCIRYLPIIDPIRLMIGEDVFTYGYYSNPLTNDEVVDGYFKGNIVSFSFCDLVNRNQCSVLSFPIIEGLSGSPLLTFHNGVKVVGLNVGNLQHNIQQSNIIEYKNGKTHIQEVTSRIVEFGLSLHPSLIIDFLYNQGISNFLTTADEFQIE